MVSRILRSKEIITRYLMRACVTGRQNGDSHLQQVMQLVSQVYSKQQQLIDMNLGVPPHIREG
ncbi:hypothetical protein T12_12771 [Trichinella patagoniensis]|uniref:Uncharacterized protein n=1 Tax=Trichinella patagoniensis TaxID=990121 RepID=A0A0V1A1C6_9BILA|nr:hypothetical protein T12_12771 [Trichinella patagoniensis]